jgi:hypothetical protein
MADIPLIPEANPMNDIQGLLNIISSIFGQQGNSNVTEGSQPAMDAINQLLPTLISQFQTNDFSPEAAVKDSQPLIDQIVKDLAEKGIPLVNQGEQAGGGYSSTTASLLKNDLASSAAAKGAAQVSATKTAYSQARQMQMMQLISLIGQLRASSLTRTTTNTSGALSNQGQNAAGIAALLGLIRSLTSGNSAKPKPESTTAQRGNTNPSGAPKPGSPDGERERNPTEEEMGVGTGELLGGILGDPNSPDFLIPGMGDYTPRTIDELFPGGTNPPLPDITIDGETSGGNDSTEMFGSLLDQYNNSGLTFNDFFGGTGDLVPGTGGVIDIINPPPDQGTSNFYENGFTDLGDINSFLDEFGFNPEDFQDFTGGGSGNDVNYDPWSSDEGGP